MKIMTHHPMSDSGRRFTRQLTRFLTLSALLACGCSAPNEAVELTADSAEPLTIAERQANMNAFYDMNNSPMIFVHMHPDDWAKLKAETPTGGCDFDVSPNVERYTGKYNAPNVAISTSGGGLAFTNVEVKKKSFCGSFDDVKPSFKLKLPDSAENSKLGTRYLVMNNSHQDASFIRQCLGYKLFGMAGLPRSRCNFAKVFILSSLDSNNVLASDVWVNVEPIRERYFDNPDNPFDNRTQANGKLPGNLYEFERDDFKASRRDFIDVEGISRYPNTFPATPDPKFKKDLDIATAQITSGYTGMQSVIDVDNFIRYWAMEVLLKHGDGYTIWGNNVYVYNDARADLDQVKFKFIPWGIDQIIEQDTPSARRLFKVSANSVITKLYLADASRRQALWLKIQEFRETIFSRAKIAGELKTFIDLMESKLLALGVNATAEIAKERKELSLIRSAAYYYGGFTTSEGLYVLGKDSGDAMHASNTETFNNLGGSNFEVVHQGRADSAAQRWRFGWSPNGYRVTSEAYGRYLHASGSVATPAGHLAVYQTLNITDNSPDYSTWFENAGDAWSITGYFTMLSARTNRYLRFGTDDPTASGRQRVYQQGSGSLLFWN
jgi:hypothetical protein